MTVDHCSSPDGGRRAVGTIVAKNYLSFARVMAVSLLEHNPDVEVFVLLVDEWREHVRPQEECFGIVSLEDLVLEDVEQLAFKYNVVEFSTAVKPAFLRHLIDKGFSKVLYIDPDILIKGSLEMIFSRLDQTDAVVTPHTGVDFPSDGRTPDDRLPLMHGVFNLGFIGLRAGSMADAFLAWWSEKLQAKCVIDYWNGYFTDQKFVDLAVVLFPGFHVEHDTGCNVAYWNLHYRKLTFKDGRWYSNDRPLLFYHFSSYRAENPTLLSKHCSRFRFDDLPEVIPLFEEYKQRLIEAEYEKTHAWNYGYGSYRNGGAVTGEDRSWYRMLVESGKSITDPFASKDRMDEFLDRPKAGPPVPFWRRAVRHLMPPIVFHVMRKIKV